MLDYTALHKAMASLNESLQVVEQAVEAKFNAPMVRTIRAGVIQNFEFSYELCWKFIKRWLAQNLGKSEVEGVSRRELFRLAHQYRLIVSVDQWMLYHAACNETSHTYDEATAEEVLQVAKAFLPAGQALLTTLQQKNDV